MTGRDEPAAKLMVPESILGTGARQMRVELDKKSIMALASDTRLEILRSLQPMRRTVSQLSEAVNIDKAAVHRHLKKMEEGGLVRRFEDHGFVYYGLTWKARDLLAPNENTRIVILLSAIWILSLGAILFIAAGLMAQGGNDTLFNMLPLGEANSAREGLASQDEGPGLVVWGAPALALVLAAAVVAVLAFRMTREALQSSPEKAVGIDGPEELPEGD